MYIGKGCPRYLTENFQDGITNGADWYTVTGGMQDWSYLHGGTYEITLELGCFKYPKAEELPRYWLDNREALIKYIEQVHIGVKGFVRSSIGSPIKHAAISINNIQHVTYSGVDGDFYRLLLPGRYNITATAFNYESQTAEIVIPESGNLVYNFLLMRNDPQHWSSAYDFRILDNILKTRYHSNEEIQRKYIELQMKNPWMALYEKNDDMEMFHSLKITKNIGESEETKIHVLIMSSLFETSPLGREIVMNLARHVIEAFNTREPSMNEIMENAVFHFVTLNVNFNNVYEQFSRNQSICDPLLNEELGDRLLNAESDSIKSAFFKLFEQNDMSLALTFTAGDDSNLPVLSQQIPAFVEIANKGRSRIGAQNQLCPSNTHRINENESVTKITNFLYNTYHLPLFSLNLGCCKMPQEDKIAEIWRENIETLKNFVNLVRTGIKGFVRDKNGNPLRNARILIKSTKQVYRVSKNLAFFHVITVNGRIKIDVICENFTTKTIEIIAENKVLDLGVITMDFDSNVRLLKHYNVSGYVTDENGRPVESAEIGIKDLWNKKAYTNRVGSFDMRNINSDNIILTVKAEGYQNIEKLIAVNEEGIAKNIVFKLLPSDEHDMGFDNLIFIFFICIAILCTVVCAVMLAVNGCTASCPFGSYFEKRNKFLSNNYKFSLLTKKKQRSLFEDGDDYGDEDEEEELFSPPTLKRELI